jgi:hypothetical protein
MTDFRTPNAARAITPLGLIVVTEELGARGVGPMFSGAVPAA